MEQSGEPDTGERPAFTIRGDALWVSRKGVELCLGPTDAAHEGMAEHLAVVDFGA